MPIDSAEYAGHIDATPPSAFHWPSPEQFWTDCLNNFGKPLDFPRSPEEQAQFCREALNLPWYSHTRYEPFINWVSRHTRPAADWLSIHWSVISITAATSVALVALWITRAAIARGLYAVTGYDIRRIGHRWRTFSDKPNPPE